MAEVLKVSRRDAHGKRNSRRLRRSGSVPAVLYGHGEESISLTLCSDQLAAAMRHNSRLVELQGDLTESAIIRDLQWDTFGHHVLHVDLTRVSADERIEVTVSVDLRGTAPGAKAGGVIEHLLHELEVECLATAIPEKISVNVGALELEGEIKAGEVKLPEGVKLLTDADEIVVHCIHASAEEESDATVGAGAEPEVIGRKAADEEGSEEK